QGTGPLTQMLIGQAFDELVAGKAVFRTESGLDIQRALWWAAILMAANTARGLLGWGNTVGGMMLGARILSYIRDRILVQVQALDLAWHRRHGSGEVVTRTTRDADKVREAVIGGFRQIAEMTFIITASLITLAWIEPWLAIVPA